MINKINKSNKDEYIKYLEDEVFNLRKICIEKGDAKRVAERDHQPGQATIHGPRFQFVFPE